MLDVLYMLLVCEFQSVSSAEYYILVRDFNCVVMNGFTKFHASIQQRNIFKDGRIGQKFVG